MYVGVKMYFVQFRAQKYEKGKKKKSLEFWASVDC